jgi:hypothetical protein
MAHCARWIICVPWSLACSVLAVLIFNAGSSAVDEDAAPLIGNLFGAVCGGWIAVEMAVAIAPRRLRTVTRAVGFLDPSLLTWVRQQWSIFVLDRKWRCGAQMGVSGEVAWRQVDGVERPLALLDGNPCGTKE